MTGSPTADCIHLAFLEQLPRFRAHAAFAFRRVACPEARADRVAEAVALAFMHFAALYLRGKNPEAFVTTLALRCTQAVKAGRRLAGSEAAKDVLSPVAQVRHGFAVGRLPDRAGSPSPGGRPDEFADALADDARTPVPDQAAFRIDFPRWRSTFRHRDRAVLDALAGGGRTGEVAAAFGISPGRVSQLRRAFEISWAAFHRA